MVGTEIWVLVPTQLIAIGCDLGQDPAPRWYSFSTGKMEKSDEKVSNFLWLCSLGQVT